MIIVKSKFLRVLFDSLIGLLYILFALFLMKSKNSAIKSNLLLFMGIGFFINTIVYLFYRKMKSIHKKVEIEVNDERNIIISNMVKAKAGEVVQYFIYILIAIISLFDVPLWLFLSLISIDIVRELSVRVFTKKYSEEI